MEGCFFGFSDYSLRITWYNQAIDDTTRTINLWHTVSLHVVKITSLENFQIMKPDCQGLGKSGNSGSSTEYKGLLKA